MSTRRACIGACRRSCSTTRKDSASAPRNRRKRSAGSAGIGEREILRRPVPRRRSGARLKAEAAQRPGAARRRSQDVGKGGRDQAGERNNPLILIVARPRPRIGDADRNLAEVKKLAPNHPRTWYCEALLAYSQGNMPDARAAVDRARRFEPDDLLALYLSGSSTWGWGTTRRLRGATRRRGQDALRRGRAAFARHDLSSPRERVPSTVYARTPAAPLAGRSVALACRRGDLSASDNMGKAAEFFAKADKLDSGNVAGRIRLAQAKLATGDTAQAIKVPRGSCGVRAGCARSRPCADQCACAAARLRKGVRRCRAPREEAAFDRRHP